MKNIVLLIIVVITFMLSSCLKNDEFVLKTTYSGYVVDKNNNPLSNVSVQIKDGNYTNSETIVQIYTNNSGYFSLVLDYRNVPDIAGGGEFYFYVGGKCMYILPGLGKESYSFGTIVL